MKFEELELVNYCAPGCIPMLNIMRLSKDEAFELARRLADEHPETTAFYRFADFTNYYRLRETQDAYLYARFKELGGKPETAHPLSFVLEGSNYLKEWFGNGLETRILLKDIDPSVISFTIGDSGSGFQRDPNIEVLDWNGMKNLFDEYRNDLWKILAEHRKQYIEVQLWQESLPVNKD